MDQAHQDNAFWRDYAYHHGEVVLRNLPEVFAIESTNYCNIKCIMCPRGEPDIMTRSVGHMDSALFDKILADAVFFSSPCWFHWFGEPLLNPRLFEQIAVAKRKVPNLGMSTNATLLHAKNAQRILDSGLDTLMIALDGATKEVYEAVRKGPFTFEQVRDNVEQFLALKKGKPRPWTILSIIAMDKTAPELELFKEFWLARGADEVLFKGYVAWGRQDPTFLELATPEWRTRLMAPRPHNCKFLWESVVIGWDGRVLPCCFDYDAQMVMGDLKTQSLTDIWNSPAYIELRRAELQGRNCNPLCAKCADAPGHARDPHWGEDGLLTVTPLPGIRMDKAHELAPPRTNSERTPTKPPVPAL
jgi:radical SAM protein with 4Fe4S-binding SPASM domain